MPRAMARMPFLVAPARPPAPRVVRGLEALTCYVGFFRDPIGTMRNGYRRYGRIQTVGDIVFGLRKRAKLHVFAFGPEANRTVLGDPDHFRTTGVVLRGPPDSSQRRIRYGLPRMNGKKHRQQRALVMPSLQKRPVMGYAPAMVEITEEFERQWRDGQRVEMWREMRMLALRLTSRVLFGFGDPERSYALGHKLERWGMTNFRTSTWLFPVDVPGSSYRSLLRQAEGIEADVRAMVAEKRASGGGDDVLARLIRAREEGEGMTDTDLVGQITILFGASYETTVNALTWTLFLLAQHPAVMHELLDELETLGGAPPTFEQLSGLKLLEAVLKESMRLLPPLPYTIRAVVGRGAELCGRALHDGDRVVCSSFMTHHMPDLFPEPDRFDPRRWFRIDPGQYEYWPFSAGPRTCVGYLFAMTEMMIVLATILPRWRLSMVPRARVDRAVLLTLSPRFGLPMTVHRQDRRLEAAPVRGNIHEMVDLPG